jgi:hypothetical protein
MGWERRGRLSPEQEGQALVERLGGRWGADGGICRCPAHDDRTPSLSIRSGRTRLLLHCFAGCDASAILAALESRGMLEPGAAASDEDPPGGDGGWASMAARRLWDEARSIAGTPAAAYLATRGLEAAPAELRYHPRTPHGSRPLTVFRPALIAAVRDETGLVAVHRSFLDPGRPALAPLPNPRCGLGRFGRGAVRLGGAGPRLGLAEGIETALSAAALFKVPCWATLGTKRFGSVAIPSEVSELLLFLDHDSGGRRAERLAREAHAHVRSIESLVPERPSDDWNDVLRAAMPPAGRREERERRDG